MDNLFSREMQNPNTNIAEFVKFELELIFEEEFNEIQKELRKRHNSSYTEELMFDVMWSFIIKYQDKALNALDKILNDLPSHAKYYYPYLLGHLVDDSTLPYRLIYLNKYSKSTDEDIKEGAVEGLGYLNS